MDPGSTSRWTSGGSSLSRRRWCCCYRRSRRFGSRASGRGQEHQGHDDCAHSRLRVPRSAQESSCSWRRRQRMRTARRASCSTSPSRDGFADDERPRRSTSRLTSCRSPSDQTGSSQSSTPKIRRRPRPRRSRARDHDGDAECNDTGRTPPRCRRIRPSGGMTMQKNPARRCQKTEFDRSTPRSGKARPQRRSRPPLRRPPLLQASRPILRNGLLPRR